MRCILMQVGACINGSVVLQCNEPKQNLFAYQLGVGIEVEP